MANEEDILRKYRAKVENQLGEGGFKLPQKSLSREYQEFQDEIKPPHIGLYQKLCKLSENILKIKPDKKKAPLIEEAIKTVNLGITPAGAVSFSIIVPLVIAIFGSLIFYLLLESTFFVVFFLITAVSLIGPLGKIPIYMANNYRLKASNQMVLCIFYVVTYMRHTSNLEGAIEFAGEHLSPPLSTDLKKILWGMETGDFSTVKDSLEAYLVRWKKFSPEFIEAFHLIESSLYEGESEKRLASLDKALDIMLDETYEKMLHYAHDLQGPIKMLHMLGIILPILGLVILPLVVSFLDTVEWYHLAMIYNFAIPVSVFFMGKNILAKRPTGYGEVDISQSGNMSEENNVKFGGMNLKPKSAAITIGLIFLLIGFSPMLIHLFNPGFDFAFGNFELLGYRLDKSGSSEIGPFGLGASILSLFVIIGLGVGIGSYFKMRSKNVMEIRDRSKKLELEFAGALFQLGNRLADGIPAELAFARVQATMEGSVSGNFFKLVSLNIRRMGMGVGQAIFDPKYGALRFYPSAVIQSSMKVLIQSVKKGPQIAANSLMNISRYIKEIHKVDERLKDLMSEIIASMGSQIKFLTPVISGIVIGITSMITTILGKLGQQLGNVGAEGVDGVDSGLLILFGDGIPTFYFQVIVGIYVVQIIIILSILVNGIQNGSDKVNERFLIGRNLPHSTILYCFVALVIMLIFNMIAGQIIGSIDLTGG